MISLSRNAMLALLLGVFVLTYHPQLVAECIANPWLANTAYPRGSVVSHNSHEWRAKRNVLENVVPGTHKPSWADRGACDAGPGEPPTEPPGDPTPIQVFGLWHAGDHYPVAT